MEARCDGWKREIGDLANMETDFDNVMFDIDGLLTFFDIGEFLRVTF